MKPLLGSVNLFLQYTKNNIKEDICYISLILFLNGFRVIHDTVCLKDFNKFDVKMRGGGTNFSPCLSETIKIIKKVKVSIDVTRIMIYTNGYANFPKK